MDREFEFEIDLTLDAARGACRERHRRRGHRARDDAARAGAGGEGHSEAPGSDYQDCGQQMSDRRSGAIGVRTLAVILPPILAAALRLADASALWSRGTGTPFTPLSWWDATQWWRANWWVNLWLVLSAAAPTVFLAMLLFGLFQVWRLRYRGRRRLTARPGGAVRAVERGVTDNHGHSQWRSLGDAKSCSPGLTRSMAASPLARRTASITTKALPASPLIRPTRVAGAWAARRRSSPIPAPTAAGTASSSRPRRLQDDGRHLSRSDLDRQQRDPRSFDRARPDAGCRLAAPAQTDRSYRHRQRG